MQLILRPVSDTRLEALIVTDSRFAIGRNEAHFARYDRSLTEKLSRQHAEIFERDGQILIRDVKSGNGTKGNGQTLGDTPVRLDLDDEVEFGGLRYRVEHVGAAQASAASAPAAEAQVILTPAVDDGSIAAIVITQFPFLISRYSDIFAQYQKSMPDQVGVLSRSHAKIFVRNGAIYVQDLGSTNGTYVGDQRLASEPRKLETNDTVTFGDERFTYRVQVFVGALTVIEAKAEVKKLSPGTIFVNDASNFFEAYMAARNEDAAGDSAADRDGDPNGPGRKRPVGKVRRVLGDVREALRAGGPADRGLRLTVIGSVAALALAATGYVYLSWPAWQVDRLIDDRQYRAAADLANRYLGNRPSSDRLQDLATEASLKAFVPDWLAAVDAGDYAAAQGVLEVARGIGASNTQDDEILDALEVATRISALDLSSDDRSLLLSALSGDTSTTALAEQWDSRQSLYRRALLEVGRNVDGFDRYETDFYRSLRALREESDELDPLLELKENVVAALAQRDTARLRAVLTTFSEAHRDVDLAPLAEDVARYEAVEQDIAGSQWLKAYERANQTSFNTAPFREHVLSMNATVLPDAATREAYARAAQLWADGAAKESFELFEALATREWGEDAQRTLERNRTLLRDFDNLLADPSAPGFEEELFALFARLDPIGDAFLHSVLKPDFQQHRNAALARAAERTAEAKKAWDDYERRGRIQGTQRLQNQVTADYRRLAGLLTNAYQHLHESELIQQQLDAPVPQEWTDLSREVVQEIKLQTGIVSNLLVIDADVRQEKMALLPALPSD